MFKQQRQVLLTYTTWKWMWFILPLTLLMMLGAWRINFLQTETPEFYFSAIFGVGMPVMICMQWFIAVAKWQFANPRARLMPGYKSPHLSIIATALATLLVLNPLLLSVGLGISPIGPLAFALILGGLFLQALQNNAGITALPAIIIFFSGMYPSTSHFWFSGEGNYVEIHSVLAIAGLGMVVAWLWRLANLNEEMDDYQVSPLGAAGSLSRLEQAEQRKLLGRRAARKGVWKVLADRWHDRLANHSTKPVALADYGWGKISPVHRAGLIGAGLAAYGLVLNQLIGLYNKHNAFGITVMILVAAIAVPALASIILLRGRRSRMAQELLRPAIRSNYFDGLLKSLIKLTLLLWSAMTVGLWIVVTTNPMPTKAIPPQMIAGYAILSLTMQCPALAIGLRLALLRSQILFFLGCYGVGLAELGLLAFWVFIIKTQGTLPITLGATLAFITLGLPLFRWSRQCWLRAELG